jgi:EAL and modified HD-GYP domain-containing signal transduction protein
MNNTRLHLVDAHSGVDAVATPNLPGRVARHVIRQPLLDAGFHVMGYELSVNVRTPMPIPDHVVSVGRARTETLLNCVLDQGYRNAMSRKFTLLELDPEMLDPAQFEALPRENIILAVNASSPDADFLARCQALARQGHALALDAENLVPGLEPLTRLSRYLRLAVSDRGLPDLCDTLGRVRGLPGPRLIARDVQTEEAYRACRKLGFDLYQGYFFSQPGFADGRVADARHARVISLLNLVGEAREPAEIEAEFKCDPALAYKLMRFINSPAVGLRYPVRSIGHALMMLGAEPLRRWLMLLMFVHDDSDARPRALLRHALIRARLMESLARPGAEASAGGLFMVGILSLLDSLTGQPLAQALAPINLEAGARAALMEGVGPYAPYLWLARACEHADGASLEACATTLGLAPEAINQAHIAALAWAEGIDL